MDLIFIFRSIQSGDLYKCVYQAVFGVEKVSGSAHTPPNWEYGWWVSQGSTVKGTAQIVPLSRPLGDIVSNTVFTCISDYLVWLSMVWDEWTHRGLVCGLPGSLSPTIIVQCHFLGIFLASSMSITRHGTKQQIKTWSLGSLDAENCFCVGWAVDRKQILMMKLKNKTFFSRFYHRFF